MYSMALFGRSSVTPPPPPPLDYSMLIVSLLVAALVTAATVIAATVIAATAKKGSDVVQAEVQALLIREAEAKALYEAERTARIHLEAKMSQLHAAAAEAAAREAELRAEVRDARREAADTSYARLEAEVRTLMTMVTRSGASAPIVAAASGLTATDVATRPVGTVAQTAAAVGALPEARRGPVTRANTAPMDFDAAAEIAAPAAGASAPAACFVRPPNDQSGKCFAAFVSHAKADAAMEARYLQTELESALGEACFLDSDDLRDLDALTEHVRESKVQ
jgi:hypothetical protein